MLPRTRRYFAFARFCTTTGEAVPNPSFEIKAETSITSHSPVITRAQALGVNCRRWLGRGLANLRRRFFFTPGKEPFDHVKGYRDKENGDR